VAILTFAILFYLRVVLDEGKHLDENHQKRDIPAGFLEERGREKTRHAGAPHRMTDWIFYAPVENAFARRRHIPGVTPWILLKERLNAD
jgi:hypothetical protein